MFVIVASSLFCIGVLLLYKYMTWNLYYWERKKIPHTNAVVLFGDLKSSILGKEHFSVAYKNIYNRFKGCRYVGVHILRKPGILLRDPELIKDITVKDYSSFASNGFKIDPEVDRLFGLNPFVQVGEQWKTSRGHMTQHLTAAKVKFMVPHMEDVAHNMVQHITRKIDGNPLEAFEVKDLAGKYTTDVIASAIFNIASNSFQDENSTFYQLTAGIFDSNPDFLNGLKHFISFTAPELSKFINARFIPKAVEDALIQITTDALRQRIESKETRNDFFQHVLSLREKDPETFTDLYIASQAFGYLGDGYETSSTTIAYALFELASNPQLQSEARSKVKDTIKTSSGEFTYEIISELTYLDMIISETLRIYPPAAHLQKMCTQTYTLPPAREGLKPATIDAGTTIIIPVYALQMDPDYFPHPEIFNPERFNEHNKVLYNKYAYLPFGEGPRICLGMRLAFTQIKVALARVLQNFEIRLSPKCPKKPLQMIPNIMVMRPLGGIWLTFHKINSEE